MNNGSSFPEDLNFDVNLPGRGGKGDKHDAPIVTD
jgi:hypothetical protein